eukprot:GILI01033004.1.p1 GENE.GILI01033004.1~~GILI01033004.1.p1  ORF type:complete len:140 (+),score=22.48 GILI01033004.1:218-637(+)
MVSTCLGKFKKSTVNVPTATNDAPATANRKPIADKFADKEINGIASVVNLLVSGGDRVQVRLSKLVGYYNRHQVPKLVKEFLKAQGTRSESIIMDYTQSHDGTMAERQIYAASDYALLVSYFTTWVVSENKVVIGGRVL